MSTPEAAAVVRVLVVEDNADHAALITRTLRRQPQLACDVRVVADGEACLAAVAEGGWALVLLDYSLPRQSGLEVLARLRERPDAPPVVMVTGQGDERVAVAAMNAGAADYVMKTSGYLAALPTVLCKVLKQQELAREHARLHAETERALREVRAMQEHVVRGETLRALGELASGAAHHLNNLLAVILGRADLLQRRAQDEALRRPLEMILRAARDGAEVVRRIQEFARTKQVEALAPVDLDELAGQVLEMTSVRWRDAARAQGIAIEVLCEAGGVPPVAGHAASLREVLMNLVLNAVDARPAGGRIRVRTWTEAGEVVLAVSDDGVGMSEDVRRRAQEPFFTTKGVKSTGLGLSVSFGVIERHGGRLALESAPGGGTTVTIRLPAAEPAPAVDPAPPAPRTRLRVLLIDDEPAVREALADLLAAQDYAVQAAESGAEGLGLLERGPRPDLVLTDLGMPGMTGWEVAMAVRRRWPELPVGLVTGWGDEPPSTPEERQAISFILAKPFSVAALEAHLTRLHPSCREPVPA